jgi:hypothetical protein
MKFIVSSSALLKQLQQISGVINANTVLPILEDFLFEIEKNKLTVVATDLETVMKVHLDIEAKDSGKVCIPAKILLDSLKNIAEQPLTFNIDKNFAVEITSDNGKYKVMGETPDNFPKEPAADDANAFTMSSSGLVTAINKALFAVSNDDLRPAMTGVFFELDKKSITFVATDAHRLVRYTRKDVSCPNKDSFIVPKKPLNLLKSALPDNDDELNISYNSNHESMLETRGPVGMLKSHFSRCSPGLLHPQTNRIDRSIDARFFRFNSSAKLAASSILFTHETRTSGLRLRLHSARYIKTSSSLSRNVRYLACPSNLLRCCRAESSACCARSTCCWTANARPN